MNEMKHFFFKPLLGAAAVALAVVAGCSTQPSSQDLDRAAQAAIDSSFRDQGIAKVSRLKQDHMQAACSSDKPPSQAVQDEIMAEARATVQWPAGGRYIGDWKAGEKLAQSGRGLTWTDPSSATSSNGGNCYNCHQLSKAELSYGTIGPSLYQYGRNRGVTDVTAPTAQPIIEYTWIRIYNAKAYSACSTMPRFGAHGMLDTAQIADLMALLLDPKSPVNSQ